MALFIAQRSVRSASINLAAPPSRVFPLFEPLGERLWVAGWDPEMVYPPAGAAEEGMVFLTHGHASAPTVWVMVHYDPQHFEVRYVRVAPDSHVAVVEVTCTESENEQTRATVSYTFTGLSEQGNAYVRTFTEAHYHEWINRGNSR